MLALSPGLNEPGTPEIVKPVIVRASPSGSASAPDPLSTNTLPVATAFSLAALATVCVSELPLIGLARAQTIGTLKMMIPANPGGGWDQTGRALGAAMQSAKVVGAVQYENKGGAAGTLGLAQFVNSAKGDGNQMMVNGFVMVGALAMNKSPVTLDQVTPIARLTEEIQVIDDTLDDRELAPEARMILERADDLHARPPSASHFQSPAGSN